MSTRAEVLFQFIGYPDRMTAMADEIVSLRARLEKAEKVVNAAYALHSASIVNRISVDDVQEKLAALFAAIDETPEGA